MVLNLCILIDKLQRVYNIAARLITRTTKMDHFTPVPIHLHWLPVEYRSQYKLIIYVFQALHGLIPVYLTELVKPYVPLRSQSASLLQVPTTRPKTQYGNRRFDKTASTLWKNIPLQLKTMDSLSTFKSYLKTFLFKQAFRL